jgi:voltage-gated potassium channel Kch
MAGIAVTMTTIGYGEIFPVTHLGRLVVTSAAIWGAFLIASFVVSIMSMSDLEEDE